MQPWYYGTSYTKLEGCWGAGGGGLLISNGVNMQETL